MRLNLRNGLKLTISAAYLQICCSCGMLGHGFDREELRSQLALQVPSISYDEIRNASLAQSDLVLPFSVGVFYRESLERDLTNTRASQWSAWDKKRFSESLQKLKEKNIISDYSSINPLLVAGRDLKSLLLAAAHSHVDTVLQISGIGEVDTYDNPWSITYLPFFTLFFVRGTNVDALYKIKAELWDVKNQYLFFAVDFENIQKEKRPGWLRYEQRILDKAKAQTIEMLRPELYNRLVNISKRAQAPQQQQQTQGLQSTRVESRLPATNFTGSQLLIDK